MTFSPTFLRGHTSRIAIAALAGSAFILGGCGDKNKTNSTKDVAALAKVEARTVDEAQAMKALDGLSLDNSGDGIFTWTGRDGKAGNYTYSGVTIKNKKGEATNVGSLEIKGAHMDGEQAVFDALAMKNISATGKDGEKVTAGHFEITKPSPALVKIMALGMAGKDTDDVKATGPISFGAVSFSDLNVADDETNMKVSKFAMGADKSKKGLMTLTGLDVKSKENGDNVKIALDELSISGVNIDKYRELFNLGFAGGFEAGKNGDKMSDAMKAQIEKGMQSMMNPYDMVYDRALIKGGKMNLNGIMVDMPLIEGKGSEKNGVITMTSSMNPVTIKVDPQAGNAEVKEFGEMLTEFGLSTIEITGGGTQVLDKANDKVSAQGGFMKVKQLFNLDMDYSMQGYKAFADKAASVTASGGDEPNPMQIMGMMSALKIENARFALKDEGIINAGFKMAAKQQGGTPDALRAQAKAALAMLPLMAQDQAQQELAGQAQKALAALLDNGGTLVLDINPQRPVNVGMLAAGGMFDIGALGLTISHK